MAQANELKILRIVLAVLAAGLVVVIGFVIRREVIRSQALKNINKNAIEVAITKTETDFKGTTSGSAAKDNATPQRSEGNQKEDMALIRNFYEHVLDISHGEWKVTEYLSSDLAKRIWEKDYEGTYSIWVFRTGLQDGPEDTSKLISITPMQEGWYEVIYSDMGTRGVTLVHVSNGAIDDYKTNDNIVQGTEGFV